MSRIVLTTVGSLGDLHPTLAIALELRRRGHVPVVATHPGYRARVAAAGLEFAAVRPDIDASGAIGAVMKQAMHEQRGSEYVVRELVLPHVRDTYPDLLAACAGADAILSHVLSFAAPLIAEQHSLPWFTHVLQPMTMFSAYDPGQMQALPASRWFATLGPGVWKPLWALARRRSRAWFREVDALRADLGLPPAAGHPLFDGASPMLHLALFPAALAEPQPDWPRSTVVTGLCLHDRDERGGGMAPGVDRFIDAGTPPIVFTLGSSGVWDPGRFFAEAANAAAMLERRAVLLVGPEPQNVPSPLPPGVLAVDYAPHSELFGRACAIVHHGGAGTTGQALRAGKPMVIVPYSHDQPDNAWRCERLGVARTVPRRSLSAQRLANALRAMLEDARVATRAAAIGERVRAERGAAAAADAIERAMMGRGRSH